MSLLELMCISDSQNHRRGLRLPVLLGRLHLGLIFSESGGRRSTDLRSFLFIATVLITKCGTSAFPNRTKPLEGNNNNAIAAAPPNSIGHLDCDQQDFPMEQLIAETKSIEYHRHREIINNPHDDSGQNVKTLGYFLKGLILPMLISLTLSFGFIIWKKRMKRERIQQIQTAVEEARSHQQGILIPNSNHPPGSLVSNALLSVLDGPSVRHGQWNLVSGVDYIGDDYIGEGGETARHKPYFHDKPPDYATVFDPPSYEEATQTSWYISLPHTPHTPEDTNSSHDNCGEDGDDDEGKLLMGGMQITTD